MFRMFWQILAVYLAAVNLAAFAAFGIDKWKAVRQRWRIPEATLLGLALAGGALGGLVLATQLFSAAHLDTAQSSLMPVALLVGAVLLAGLALVTGMIWARRSWGVWWTWDPRLTTTLVMWFIYAGYLVLRGLDLPPQRKRMICAVVGVVAFLDVPLVFLSARLWRSIHPAVFASKGGGLEPEMKLTAIACVAAMGLFWAGLVWLRTRQLGLRDRMDSLRLQAED